MARLILLLACKDLIMNVIVVGCFQVFVGWNYEAAPCLQLLAWLKFVVVMQDVDVPALFSSRFVT